MQSLGKYLIPGQKLSPQSLADYYSKNAQDSHAGFAANDWGEPEEMLAQFEFLVEHVDLNGKTLLDVGAGNGLLFDFLAKRNIKPASITAIDISSGQIAVIREQYPEVHAIEGDFFTYEFEQTYDVITMFGVAPCLKFIFPQKHRLSSLLRLLDRALQYSTFGVAWSFLNHNCYERAEEEGYEYVYYYPEEVCTILSGARYDLSTVLNDLVTSCFIYSEDANESTFRFNLNRIDEKLGLLK
ncbi:MAG: class I SAM-dependent methyltransferase [Bacteroidota bacterium]|nr:class I SAM-dependent methyltransferase [Bacteroidota bacterium]MDP4232825.1 class I SAM-dependent methyltransferase [Bacteroidota bacterium]MDP4242494.1 class I SAM-dependent methyltransferase [Bacteroidota bacterium]MDP4289028.1 class I SAM-dependent methyltransferase [Bacteroidota bacterium]